MWFDGHKGRVGISVYRIRGEVNGPGWWSVSLSNWGKEMKIFVSYFDNGLKGVIVGDTKFDGGDGGAGVYVVIDGTTGAGGDEEESF